MKKSIIVDMDEVIARYTDKVVRTLYRETGVKVDLDRVKGKFLSQSLSPELIEIVSSYPYRKGFFRDLEVMPDSRQVLQFLSANFEIIIASSCLQHPNSVNDKLSWLYEHFPFISYQKIVLCGEKKHLTADFLIDDHPRHLESFGGKSLLFSAFHNTDETRFERFNTWIQVENYFRAL